MPPGPKRFGKLFAQFIRNFNEAISTFISLIVPKRFDCDEAETKRTFDARSRLNVKI